jgi:FtsZ-interacting cell division protein YlmF
MSVFKKIADFWAGPQAKKNTYISDFLPVGYRAEEPQQRAGFVDKEDYPVNRRRTEHGGRFSSDNSGNINMCYPKRFEDIIKLIDSIKRGEAVIVDLGVLPEDVCQKMLDFMSGAIYALSGSMQRISGTTFLFAPPFVRVNNDR